MQSCDDPDSHSLLNSLDSIGRELCSASSALKLAQILACPLAMNRVLCMTVKGFMLPSGFNYEFDHENDFPPLVVCPLTGRLCARQSVRTDQLRSALIHGQGGAQTLSRHLDFFDRDEAAAEYSARAWYTEDGLCVEVHRL